MSNLNQLNYIKTNVCYPDDQYDIQHHGIKGQKWGRRRFQNNDGTLTPEGRLRYGQNPNSSNQPFSKNKMRYLRKEGAVDDEAIKSYHNRPDYYTDPEDGKQYPDLIKDQIYNDISNEKRYAKNRKGPIDSESGLHKKDSNTISKEKANNNEHGLWDAMSDDANLSNIGRDRYSYEDDWGGWHQSKDSKSPLTHKTDLACSMTYELRRRGYDALVGDLAINSKHFMDEFESGRWFKNVKKTGHISIEDDLNSDSKKSTELGKKSNLIADIILNGASSKELARVINSRKDKVQPERNDITNKFVNEDGSPKHGLRGLLKIRLDDGSLNTVNYEVRNGNLYIVDPNGSRGGTIWDGYTQLSSYKVTSNADFKKKLEFTDSDYNTLNATDIDIYPLDELKLDKRKLKEFAY